MDIPQTITYYFPPPISISLFYISFLLHCHYPLRAGGLFHFKKDHNAYSITAEDYDSRNGNHAETPATTSPTRAFSRQLVSYIAAFLPTAPYFKSSDSRISAVCDDHYSATLAILEETADEMFKAYMTRKTQGWFRGWGCPRPSDAAAASPGPGAAPNGAGSGGGAGAATPGRLPAPDASDDEGGATLITPGGPAGGGGDHVPSPILDVGTSGGPA